MADRARKDKREFTKGTHNKRAMLTALFWLVVLGAVLALLLYILNGTRYKLTDTVTVKFSDGSYCITETYTSRFDGSYQACTFYDAEGIRAAALQTENGQILSADFSTSGANGKYVYKTVYIADDGYTAAWVYFDENGTMLED